MRFFCDFPVSLGIRFVIRLPLLDLDRFLPNYFQFIGYLTIHPAFTETVAEETMLRRNTLAEQQQNWNSATLRTLRAVSNSQTSSVGMPRA
jgi:hypothetical protein